MNWAGVGVGVEDRRAREGRYIVRILYSILETYCSIARRYGGSESIV